MELSEVVIHGNRVAYRAAGEGPAVILIHGMAGCSDTWEPVVDRLAARRMVLAPDLLGHGGSAKPRGDYSLGAMASGIRDLCVALGVGRATVVGHSLGGGIAMQFAYQFPERCERLVLVSSGGLGREVGTLLRALSLPGAEYLLALACAPRLARAQTAASAWLERIGIRAAPALAEVLRSYRSLSDGAARAAFLDSLRAVVDIGGQRVSASDRLYLTSDMPTLIVWGDRDPFIPVAHARTAHELMPRSRLEIFEGAGHFPHRDDPERFTSTLEGFIATTEPARLSADDLRHRMTIRSSR